MSNGKLNKAASSTDPAPNKAEAAKLVPSLQIEKSQRLFRPTDWLAFGITTLFVFIGYFLTLAPDLTLEDSGELAVGSYYAGIPHPPGYPAWAIVTWLFSHLVPISNIAYRVALSSAVMGAFACGILALIVSRGSSMMIEGISDLKTMDRRWENAICLVSGLVCGILIGFNGYMWSQSIIVEVYSATMLSMAAMLLCLLRWVYAPQQRRYLYLVFFLFGICVTNHQTLLLAAIGLEVAVIAASPKMGRDFLLGNSVVYIVALVLKQQGIFTGLDNNPPVLMIFHFIGIASTVATGWLSVQTKALGTEWKATLICGLLWVAGAGFYLWMPIAGMSNPPMQWGYPRTVEGFFHALSRGQYEKTVPVNIMDDPFRYFRELGILFNGIVNEFNWIFALIALVPFFYFLRMQRRERAWMISLFALYCCMGFFLLALLNPSGDRQSIEIGRVQFTASHGLIAVLVGYGVTLILATMATHYQAFRRWGIWSGIALSILAIYSLANVTTEFFGSATGGGVSGFFKGITLAFAKDQYGLPVIAGLMLLALLLLLTLSLVVSRTKPMMTLALGIFTLMPLHSVMSNWFENEQRGHLFGFWFGHDMFTPPFNIYPEMAKDAVLYGGTDPGRFCPTYMIFNESFIPASKKRDPNFDRRDVYIITQNALADGTYLMYIRAHYNRSKQRQYDLPFFQELCRGGKEKEFNYTTNLVARAVAPLDKLFGYIGDQIERERRAGSSLFKDSDFKDLNGLAAQLQKRSPDNALSTWLFDNVSPKTQELLKSGANDTALRNALVKDLNILLERELIDSARIRELKKEELDLNPEVSEKDRKRKEAIAKEISSLSKRGPLYTAERFQNVKLPETTMKFVAENPQSHTRIRLNRLLLEAAYPNEIAKSLGGVYPDREIYIATPEDSARCFREYMEDAQRRLQNGRLDPGEDVRIVDNRVQVSGQVAVMAINGLLTKVMFDANPDHEFYVEESFPLKWMYPHLTPYGIIMKINREPLPELTDDIIRKDHEFWSKFSERLIGNWITYDTSVKEICDFAEKVYLRRDFAEFKGDRKFVRDDQAQKAFSKLRSSIGGVYAWRINDAARKNNALEQSRMIKEADFTFKQAFAFCPYSPEAVFRYVQLLVNIGRVQDALLIAKTCQKLDPENGQVAGLISNLTEVLNHGGVQSDVNNVLDKLEARYKADPNDFQNALNLASASAQLDRTNRAAQVLEALMNHPNADTQLLLAVARGCSELNDFNRLETVLMKLVKLSPDMAEGWYDLAALKAAISKNDEALTNLERALLLNEKAGMKPKDLRAEAVKDPRFATLLGNSEFQRITSMPAK